MRTIHSNLARVLTLLLAITSPVAGQSDPAEPPPGDAVTVAEAFEPGPQEAGGTGGAVPGILAGPVTNAANGHVYYLLTSANWTDSQTQAQALGGHLVTINDAAENAWVYGTFSSFGGISRALWTGLNDATQEGAFVWVSGESAAYRNWSPGEPNNFNPGQDYVSIFPRGDARASQWDDENDVANLPDVPATPVHGVVELSSPPTCLPPPAGLISWWRAEGDASDSIGGNTGVLNNGVRFVTGKVGQAFDFTGVNDFVAIPDNPLWAFGTNEFTIELWARFNSAGLYHMLVANDESGGSFNKWIFWVRDGQLQFQMSGPGLGDNQIAARPFTPVVGQYYHLAVTRRGINYTIFVDGTVFSTGTYAGAVPNAAAPLTIGGSAAEGIYSDTHLDEVSIYSRALSLTEVQAIYNAGDSGKCTSPQPPVITSQPQNRVAPLGTTASFTVGAGGTAPLSYQWYFSNAPIAGATAPTLELANVQFANAGDYRVVVSNLLGSVTSSNATLTVTPPPACLPPPSGLISWWRGEGNAMDSVSTNHGELSGGVGTTTGIVDQALDFDGASGLMSVPDSPSWAFGSSAFTIELWVSFDSVRLNNVLVANDEGGGFRNKWLFWHSHGHLEFYINDAVGFGGIGSHPFSPVLGRFYHVAVTRAGNSYTFYIDGVAVQTVADTRVVPDANAPLTIGYAEGIYTDGKLDETSIYGRALSAAEIQMIHSVGPNGKCLAQAAPSITSQPQDRVAPLGTTASFTVSAGGTAPLSYQWYFSNAPIAGATAPTLELANVQFANAGNYHVVVSNLLGSVTSSNATLAVFELGPNFFDDFDPTIDAPQWSAFGGTVLATNHGGFVSGPNSLWFGGTGSRFTATRSLNTLIGGDLSFYLRFGNASNPWERVDLPNEGVVLEYSLNSGSSWNLISTYNTSNFLTGWVRVDVPVPAAAQSANTRFRWRQLANSGSTFDHWALDDISIILAPTPPTFSAQPTNQFAPIGTNVTITVGVRGSRPLAFQWRFNGADLPGATNASLVLSNVQPAQVGLYSVAVANAYGSATSDAMLLLVTPPISGLTVPALDTGWYDSTGFHAPTSGNYMAGDTTSQTRVPPYRNFFVFNVPNFSNEVASARFRVRTFNIVSPTGSEDFELNEVTTPIGVLREGGSNRVAVWEDLADGPAYGTRTFTTAERSNLVEITLSPAAVTGILAARGTGFALGGEITSLDATFRNNEFVFGSSTSASSNNAFLLLNFVPPPSPPALSALPDQTIDEDSVLGPLTFAVYDAQTDASNLVLSATSSNPALVPDAAIVIGGTEIVRSLTVTPAANQHGTTIISLVATDGDGNSTTNQFTLTVLPINDPPVADASATLLTVISPNNVDAQVILDGSLSSDVDGDALTYAWRDGGTDALLGSGVVAIITRPVGTNPIVLVVSDGLTNDTTTITVVVKSAAQAVGDLISFLNGVTVPRNKQALLASLEAAMASFTDGNFTAAVNQLEAFQNKVRAQVGPDDPVLADTLISLTQQIIDAIVPPAAPPAGLLRTEMSVTAVKRLPNGRVKLHFPGWASRVYLIQASSDLVTWETIGTGRHLDRGAFEFEDGQATLRGHRFYRLVLP